MLRTTQEINKYETGRKWLRLAGVHKHSAPVPAVIMAEIWRMTARRRSCSARLWFTDVPLQALMKNPAPSPKDSSLCFLVFSNVRRMLAKFKNFQRPSWTPPPPSLCGPVIACFELFTVNRKSLQARSHTGLIPGPQQKHTGMPHKPAKTTMMASPSILVISPELLRKPRKRWFSRLQFPYSKPFPSYLLFSFALLYKSQSVTTWQLFVPADELRTACTFSPAEKQKLQGSVRSDNPWSLHAIATITVNQL